MEFLSIRFWLSLPPTLKFGEGSHCAAILEQDLVKSFVCETFEIVEPSLIQDWSACGE